jgi:hypothetical protein
MSLEDEMKFALLDLGRSRRLTAFLVLGLAGLNGGLALTLAAFAMRPHPLVITPMVKDAQLVVPGQVPPEAVRRFAVHYLYFLDDYTAHTVKDRSNYVLRFISPNYAEKAAKDLTDRLRYAERAREAAQLVTPPPSEIEVTRTGPTTYRAVVPAVKRVYIADRLTQESHLRYTVDLRSVLPTDADPYGFIVEGQSVEAAPPKDQPVVGQAAAARRTP